MRLFFACVFLLVFLTNHTCIIHASYITSSVFLGSSIVSPSLCVCAMPKSKRRSHHKSSRSHKRSRTHDGPRDPRESSSESSAESSSSSCSSAEQRMEKLLPRRYGVFCKLPRNRVVASGGTGHSTGVISPVTGALQCPGKCGVGGWPGLFLPAI